MEAWAEFTPYLASPVMTGRPKGDGVHDGGAQLGAVDSQEPGRTLKIFYSEGEMAEGPRADLTWN